MARLIFVGGRSGSGKSTSQRNLNPSESIIIDADANGLPFKGGEQKFNVDNKNYVMTSKMPVIFKVLRDASDRKNIKIVTIDTWSRIMTDAINADSFRKAVDGRKAWGEMAAQQYDLFNLIRHELRGDLDVYLFSHTEREYNDMGLLEEKLVTQGRQLDKFKPESFSNIVLYSEVLQVPGKPREHVFRTVTTGMDTCKTPMGMFEDEYIPNDLAIVDNYIREYYDS